MPSPGLPQMKPIVHDWLYLTTSNGRVEFQAKAMLLFTNREPKLKKENLFTDSELILGFNLVTHKVEK